MRKNICKKEGLSVIELLHTNSSQLVDVLTYWIKKSKSINVVSPDSVAIVLPDDTTKLFSNTSGRLLIDGVPITTEDIEVTNIEFTGMPRSLRMAFELKAKEGEESIAATTTIAKRNNF
jgi:hypothetical protein